MHSQNYSCYFHFGRYIKRCWKFRLYCGLPLVA